MQVEFSGIYLSVLGFVETHLCTVLHSANGIMHKCILSPIQLQHMSSEY